MTLSGFIDELAQAATKNKELLAQIDRIIPWSEWIGMIQPHYYTVSLPVTASYVSGTTVTVSYNFTSAKTVSFENVGGTWQFPVNSESVTRARKIYIPVETKDGTYTITLTVKALDPQATALTGSNVYLTDTKTVTLTIDGSMYDDAATGNS